MQLKIKYWLLSFLILLAVVSSTASPYTAHPASVSAGNLLSNHPKPFTDAASVVDHKYSLTDFFLSNIPAQQAGGHVVGKRVLADKDLLVVRAVKYGKVVKASSCYQVQFTDSLTHIFLFLFPYHFFW